MNAQLAQGTRWVYVGPGPDRNVMHLVTSVDQVAKEVTTWSAPSKNPEEGGQSFLGSIQDFLHFFRPTAGPATTTTVNQ